MAACAHFKAVSHHTPCDVTTTPLPLQKDKNWLTASGSDRSVSEFPPFPHAAAVLVGNALEVYWKKKKFNVKNTTSHKTDGFNVSYLLLNVK